VKSCSEVQARCLAVPDPSPNRAFPLVRLPYPAECSIRSASVVTASTLPSCPLPSRAGLQGLHPPDAGKQVNGSRILSWASAPLQRLPKHRAAALSSWFPRNPTPGTKTVRQLAAPPLRFRPLQRLSSSEQRHEWSGMQSRPPAPSGYRNLLAPSSAPSLPALFHAGSALGVTLQSLLPPAQPHAVSSAVPLLAFPPPSGSCSARESVSRSSCLS